MRITKDTPFAAIASAEKYITKRSANALKKAAEDEFGSMYDLTFAQFWACSNGDFSILGDLAMPTVLQVYWKRRFEDFVNEFAEALKKLTIPQSPEEAQAAQGLIKVGWDESILVFAQQWFGLHSYKEAEQLTIGEILIAKRAQYNRDRFQRQMSQIQMSKFKKK